MENIVLSMKYDFIKYIIPPMLIALLVLLIIKLKRKWMITLPVAAAFLAFIVCLTFYNVANEGIVKGTYIKNKSSEMITICDTHSATIFDMSSGGFAHFQSAHNELFENGATEIKNIVLTHYHQYHARSLFKICQKYLVRNIYLPHPTNENDSEEYIFIINEFRNSEVNIITYTLGTPFELEGNIKVQISKYLYIKRSAHPMFTVSIQNKGEGIIYLTSSIYESNGFNSNLSEYENIIFGKHGPNIRTQIDSSALSLKESSNLIFADAKSQGAFLAPGSQAFAMEETDRFNIILDGQ